MPTPSKSPERRQRQNKPSDVSAFGSNIVRLEQIPEYPAQLSRDGEAEWKALWESPVAATFDLRSDMPSLTRLFHMREKLAAYELSVEGQEVTSGSKDQLIMHPLVRQCDTLRTEIRSLEDRFGLSPMARLKLNITYGDAARSLEDLNRSIQRQSGDVDDDPRRTIIDIDGPTANTG